MVFPTTTLLVHLPEEIGFIKNVNAVIVLTNNEQIIVPCKHEGRYSSSERLNWPKIFDENSQEISISENFNTSIFQGIYTFYNEMYLEGKFYFSFEVCKNSCWHRYKTNSCFFKEDKDNYLDLLKFLNKK